MRQIILDTETTGLEPLKGHRLTEIGCIEMIDRRLTGRRYQTYLNPERDLDPDAARITGLTEAFLKDKPKFSEVVHTFIAFLEESPAELIIHNASFDLAFLNHELNQLNHPFAPLEKRLKVIDTLLLARRLHPGQRNSLDALCKRYNIDNTHRELHGALLDVELLAQVYLAMTAGQTHMLLSVEQREESQPQIRKTFPKVKRNSLAPLPIFLANEQECRLHLEKMLKLETKKKS